MAREIKKGMWVTFNGKVGIAHIGEYREKDGSMRKVEEFHQVDDKGNTAVVAAVPFAKLKQARWRDIPKARLAHLGSQQAALTKARLRYE